MIKKILLDRKHLTGKYPNFHVSEIHPIANLDEICPEDKFPPAPILACKLFLKHILALVEKNVQKTEVSSILF